MPADDALRAYERAGALEAPADATPMRTGLINRTWDVSDAKGRRFVLQCLSPAFDPRVNDNVLAVTEHLAARGVATFRVVAIAGRPALDLGSGGIWRLLSHVGGTSFERPRDEAQVAEAGRAVAAFHRALFDFEPVLHPIGFPFHETRRHFDDLAQALRELHDHPFHGEIESLAEQIFASASQLELFEDVPQRVIHGDLKLDNLLFEPARPGAEARVSAIIDLDTVSRKPLAYDWGDAMRSWCNRHPEDEPQAELDLDFAVAAARGLRTAFDARPDVRELDSLCRGLEVVSLELCARFATDALRECHWAWDAERFERAAEHNLNRALGQLSLFRQARETRDQRARAMWD